MTKKVLFIIPPHGPISSFNPKETGQKKITFTSPYGLLSIISYVNVKKLYHIEILDCNKIIFENINSKENDLETLIETTIKNTVLNGSFNYIGISVLFNTCFPHLKIIKNIKNYSPSSFIVVGGGLATNLYQELFKEFPEIDAICYGEGEIPFKKLLENELTDLSLLSKAWITKESIARNQVPEYEFVENLDEIPLIDYSYIDFKKYNGRSLSDKEGQKIEATIHTSRGCPFRCVFCGSSKVHGKKIRTLSLNRIIETIQHYQKTIGMTILIVEDDHFLYDKERALAILKFVKDNNIHIEFTTGVAVYKIDDDIAKAFADAKVKIITLAIESGSDYVLKNVINKPLKVATIITAVSYLKKYDIRIHAFIVIGIPGETDEHRQETIDLLKKLELDWVYVFIAIPIVGSRLYEICKTKNYFLDDNFHNHIVTKANIKAPGIDPKLIEQYWYYVNVVINLIGNSNFKNRKYDIAEQYFKMVVNSYPKEAIAHYMLYKLYKNTNNPKYEEHYTKYIDNYESHMKKYNDNELFHGIINE